MIYRQLSYDIAFILSSEKGGDVNVKVAEVPKSDYEGRLLDLHELISILKFSKFKIYGLINRKKNPIPSVKIGKNRRFPLDKVRWWMENQDA